MPVFHVQRSMHINAFPDRVFEVVADYGTWTSWSPWLCAEPEAKVTVTEDPRSVGSVYAWSGEVVGAGELEHRNLEPGQKIDDEIRFLRPMRSVSRVSFDMQAEDNGTRLTWHMNGSLPWFLFWMTPMMETFIGRDYERGLAMLKEFIETGTVQSRTTVRGIQPTGPRRILGVRRTCSLSEIGPSMESAFSEVRQAFRKDGLPDSGAVVSAYHSFNMKKGIVDFTSGVDCHGTDVAVPAGLTELIIPASKALVVEHVGKYSHLGNAWSTGHQHIRYKKLKPAKIPSCEIYRNNPHETAEEDLITEVNLPLR